MRGTREKAITANHTSIRESSTKEPMSMTVARNTFSGPWWASSDTSCRSLIIRDMRVPVLFSSKKAKGSFCRCRNISRRISPCIRTPTMWPQYWMTKFRRHFAT